MSRSGSWLSLALATGAREEPGPPLSAQRFFFFLHGSMCPFQAAPIRKLKTKPTLYAVAETPHPQLSALFCRRLCSRSGGERMYTGNSLRQERLQGEAVSLRLIRDEAWIPAFE